MTHEVHDLSRRLAALERQNTRLKKGGAALAVFALAGLGMSLTSAMCDTVTAERFQLVDSQGRQRALLDCYGRDETIFRMSQNGGKSSLEMVVNDDGSSLLTITDAQGHRRSALAVDVEGVPELAFYDAEGEVVRRSRGLAQAEDYLERNSR